MVKTRKIIFKLILTLLILFGFFQNAFSYDFNNLSYSGSSTFLDGLTSPTFFNNGNNLGIILNNSNVIRSYECSDPYNTSTCNSIGSLGIGSTDYYRGLYVNYENNFLLLFNWTDSELYFYECSDVTDFSTCGITSSNNVTTQFRGIDYYDEYLYLTIQSATYRTYIGSINSLNDISSITINESSPSFNGYSLDYGFKIIGDYEYLFLFQNNNGKIDLYEFDVPGTFSSITLVDSFTSSDYNGNLSSNYTGFDISDNYQKIFTSELSQDKIYSFNVNSILGSINNYGTYTKNTYGFTISNFEVNSTGTLNINVENLDTSELIIDNDFNFTEGGLLYGLNSPTTFNYGEGFFDINQDYRVFGSYIDENLNEYFLNEYIFNLDNYYITSEGSFNYNGSGFDIESIEVTQTGTINYEIYDANNNLFDSGSINIYSNTSTDLSYINDNFSPNSDYIVNWNYTYLDTYELGAETFRTEDSLYLIIGIDETCPEGYESVVIDDNPEIISYIICTKPTTKPTEEKWYDFIIDKTIVGDVTNDYKDAKSSYNENKDAVNNGGMGIISGFDNFGSGNIDSNLYWNQNPTIDPQIQVIINNFDKMDTGKDDFLSASFFMLKIFIILIFIVGLISFVIFYYSNK